MNLVRKIMRLVAQSLQHSMRRIFTVKIDLPARLGQKMCDLAVTAGRLDGGNHRQLSIFEVFQRLQSGLQMRAPAVDQDQIGQLFRIVREANLDKFSQSFKFRTFVREPERIFFAQEFAVFPDRFPGGKIRARNMRDVETFEPCGLSR